MIDANISFRMGESIGMIYYDHADRGIPQDEDMLVFFDVVLWVADVKASTSFLLKSKEFILYAGACQDLKVFSSRRLKRGQSSSLL